jgi:hypothetical protein
MQQLFLDKFSLSRLAKGIQARQTVLDEGGKTEEADTAFKQVAGWTYSPEMSIDLLEQTPMINDLLVAVLNADHRVSVEKNNGKVDPVLVEERDNIWQKYEIMRRVVAFEYECLIVDKTEI